jgi:hypothetical protein
MKERERDASSSDMPPDKKVMPGTAGGTVCCSTRTVARAISWGGAGLAHSLPLRTMFGLSRVPVG